MEGRVAGLGPLKLKAARLSFLFHSLLSVARFGISKICSFATDNSRLVVTGHSGSGGFHFSGKRVSQGLANPNQSPAAWSRSVRPWASIELPAARGNDPSESARTRPR